MAVLLPGAHHRLLAGKSTTPLAVRWITLHTAVGTLNGTEAWFTPSGRPYSHFGVGGSGEVRQWQDLRYRAASDLEGNPYSISWECEDHGPLFPTWSGSDVPEFTGDQADALVVGLSWCCHRFGLPKTAIRSSCPHERGIGWHRLGIDPWRAPGCLKWSNHRGKACPGDRRIRQLINDIIPAVSAPEDTMLSPEDKDWLRKNLANVETYPLLAWGDKRGTLEGDTHPHNLEHVLARLDAIEAQIAGLDVEVDVDEAQLVAPIVEGIVAALPDVDAEALRAAAEAGVRAVFADAATPDVS